MKFNNCFKQKVIVVCLFTLLFSNKVKGNEPRYTKEFYFSFEKPRSQFKMINYQTVQSIIPNSRMVKEIPMFSSMRLGYHSSNEGFNFGIQLRKNQIHEPTIRIGLNVSSGSSFQGSFWATNRFRVDTLVSQQNGAQYFVDSVVYQSYRLQSFSNLINLDISKIWRSKNKNKLTLYSGFGMQLGVAIFAQTRLEYSFDTYYQNPFFYRANTIFITPTRTEIFDNKTRLFTSVYLPFGIDYKISKKENFWTPFHLFLESRIKFLKEHIPEIKTDAQINISAAFGLRYKI